MPDPKPGEIRFDPDPLPLKDGPGKRQRAPLLLLPMRLEYRVVDRASAPKVVPRTELQAQIAEIRRAFGALKPDDKKGRDALAAKLATLTREAKPQPVQLADADLKTRTEIWLRWYPDNGFAEAGIAPPTAPETEALDAFLAHPYAQDWPKLGDETLVALWAELESVAGPARAVHLMRSRHREPAQDHEARIGRYHRPAGENPCLRLRARRNRSLRPRAGHPRQWRASGGGLLFAGHVGRGQLDVRIRNRHRTGHGDEAG